jgi:hypothetical protein
VAERDDAVPAVVAAQTTLCHTIDGQLGDEELGHGHAEGDAAGGGLGEQALPGGGVVAEGVTTGGAGRELMKEIASSRSLTVNTGRMGPKISSCMTGASGATSASTVGP